MSAYGRAVRGLWALDPEVTFLNHGSFGATPRSVLDAQSRWRERLEREPVELFVRTLPPALRDAADRVAPFLGARGKDVVFVDNATTGVNVVVGSLRFAPGDEIATTSHVYGAVRKTLRHFGGRQGAVVVEAHVPFPVPSEDEVVARFEAVLTSRTRLAVVDHITSASGVLLPIQRLVDACRARGIPVLVDGAHVPGHVPVDLSTLGADWWVGNLHKWLFAPKGAAVLWARPDRQKDLHPPVISHGYGAGWLAEFDFLGTRDPSPWLCAPDGLAFADQLGGDALRRRNLALADAMARRLADAWGTTIPSPPSMRVSMVTLRPPFDAPATDEEANRLRAKLYDEHRIEVPFMALDGVMWLRISAQAYNEPEDYERLEQVIAKMKG